MATAYQLVQAGVSKEVAQAYEEIGQLILDGTLAGFVFGGIIKGRKYFVSCSGTAYADPTLARGVTAAIDDELQLMVHTRQDRATTIL